MEIIKFAYYNERYYLNEDENRKARILGYFLADDVINNSKKFVDWANNPDSLTNSSNITFLNKENGTISVCDLIDEEGPCLNLKRETFIQVLEAWDKLNSQKFPFIVMKIDDPIVHVEISVFVE